MKKLTTAIVLSAACAAASAEDFSYTYVEVGYWDRTDTVDIDLSDDDVESDGYSLKLSLQTDGGLLLQLSARQGESDEYWGFKPSGNADTDMEAYGAFIGGAHQYSEKMSLWGGFGYERADISLPHPEVITGYANLDTASLGVGIRYWVLRMIEVNGAVNYVHLSGSDGLDYSANDLQLNLGARFQPWHLISVGVGVDYRVDTGSEGVNADVRLQF